MLKRFRWSLSARLVIFFVGATLILTIVSTLLLGKAFSRHFQENIHPFLMQHLDYIQAEIGTPPDTNRAAEIASLLPLDIQIFSKDYAWASSGVPIDPAHFRQRPRRFPAPAHRAFHPDSQPGMIDGQVALKRRVENYDIYFILEHGRPGKLGLFGRLLLISVILVSALTYLHTRWLFKPVQAIRDGVMRISRGKLDQQVDVHRTDELGELATKVNQMAQQIQRMLDAKRQLLLAISHELRSPLSRMKVNLALIENQEKITPITEDIREMEQMISELLESERLNATHSTLNLEMISINRSINELVETRAWQEQITLKIADSEDLRMKLDASRIKLLLKNILENALAYNRPKVGAVKLETSIRDDTLTISVLDHGTGVDSEHIEHLSEAFYRVDPARQRNTGGYGLGLYLCRLIAEAHGGILRIESEIDKYTRVIVNLPIG